MGILDTPPTPVGIPQSLPVTPITRDVDSTYSVNNAILVPTTVNRKTRVRRARLNVVTAGGDLSVGAYDAALNWKTTSGPIGNGPSGFPIEVALPPADLDPGLAYVALSTSSGTASFSLHSVYGQQVGALLKTTAHPLPASITGATLQSKFPIVTLHPDDPTPLAGNAYNRTDMGVYVIAKNPTGGKLYGFDATTGNWKTSTDGLTWTDQGRAPETDFRCQGSKHRLKRHFVVGHRHRRQALERHRRHVQRMDQRHPFPGMPANTSGRYVNAAHNGTVLFFSNYGLIGKYATPGDPSGAYVYKSTDGGTTWTTCLSVPAARHVHCVRVDPTDPLKIHVNIGDQGAWGGFGYWYSPDAGVTWYQAASGNATPGAAPSNRYGIDICCPPGVGGTPGRIFMEGGGTRQPHVFQFYRANIGSGMYNAKIDGTVWFDSAPVDGGASWSGSVRGLFSTSEGNLFYISTGEGGTIGTRYGVWMAKGPWYTSPVLLEEHSAPWDFPTYNYGQTFEVGLYLLNTRYRMTRPKFAGQ